MKIPGWILNNLRPEFLLLLAGISYLALFAVPVSMLGIENLRMIQSFSVDEAQILSYIKEAIEQRSFGVIMHNYGYLYFYLGLAPLMLLEHWYHITDQEIVVMFRLLSSLFFLGSLWMTYVFGSFVFNKRIGVVASFLMLVGSGILYDSSVSIHPDTAQLFFMICGFYYLYRFYVIKNPKDILIVAAMAGFAFSCNYSGILLIPFVIGSFLSQPRSFSDISTKNWWASFGYMAFILIFINPFFLEQYFLSNIIGVLVKGLVYGLFFFTSVYALYRVAYILMRHDIWGNRLIRRIDFLYLIGFVFWAAFVLSSPGAVYQLNFIDSFQKVIGLANVSELNSGAPDFTAWFVNLFDMDYIGGGLVPMLAILSAPVLYFYSPKLIRACYPLWFWVVFFFLTIVILIQPGYLMYLIPMLPFIVLLAVFSAELVVTRLSAKNSGIFNLTALVLLILGVLLVGKRKTQFDGYMIKKYDPRIVVGDWLSANYPNKTRIASDHFVYVPPKLRNVKFTWGLTKTEVESNEIIVVNSDRYERYFTSDMQVKSDLSKEEKDIARNYAHLIYEIPPWRKHYSWGNIAVYTRNQ